jgi:hypothetical protein
MMARGWHRDRWVTLLLAYTLHTSALARVNTIACRQNASAASVLQASGFLGDVTVFRLNAAAVGQSGSEPACQRNTAERVYLFEAAHNPEVAGSNPALAIAQGAGNGALCFLLAARPLAYRVRASL